MITIPHAYDFEWDYEGWKNFTKYPYKQKDWNQTLLTRLNQVSANIFKASLRGGADRIRCNSYTLKVLKTLEYFNDAGVDSNIANRFRVIVDELVDNNEIYIYTSKVHQRPMFIPKVVETNDSGEVKYVEATKETETTLGDISFVLETEKNKELADKHRRMLVGKITILNNEPNYLNSDVLVNTIE